MPLDNKLCCTNHNRRASYQCTSARISCLSADSHTDSIHSPVIRAHARSFTTEARACHALQAHQSLPHVPTTKKKLSKAHRRCIWKALFKGSPCHNASHVRHTRIFEQLGQKWALEPDTQKVNALRVPGRTIWSCLQFCVCTARASRFTRLLLLQPRIQILTSSAVPFATFTVLRSLPPPRPPFKGHVIWPCWPLFGVSPLSPTGLPSLEFPFPALKAFEEASMFLALKRNSTKHLLLTEMMSLGLE